MRKNKHFTLLTLAVIGSAAMLLMAACDVNVKKEANGKDKQVDISTLVGGIHVSEQAQASDTGLSVYPGARPKPDSSDGNNKSANVNISGFGFGIKVVALKYDSDDEPTKVISFYKNQLKKYGNVLECRTSDLNLDMKIESDDSESNSNELTCSKTDTGKGGTIELKVGKKDDQHIVAVEPEGKGSSFSLVYVRTHGKNADI